MADEHDIGGRPARPEDEAVRQRGEARVEDLRRRIDQIDDQLMKLLNSATTEARASILPGLIEGIRDWADDHGLPPMRVISPRADEDKPSAQETPTTALRLEHVQRTR